MSQSKMSISSTSSTKYKQKHYECVDDIMDFDYNIRQVFRVKNKKVLYNIKERIKKAMDQVDKHRQENFDIENDGDLIVCTNHIMFEIAKYWFKRFFNSHNDSPKMYRQIRELKQERDRLHTKIGQLTAELEMLKNETTDEDDEMMADDELQLIKKYRDGEDLIMEVEEQSDVEPDVEPEQEVGKLNVQCQVKMVKECLID